MSRLRVGVVRGGPSSEYEVSLQTGGNVLQALDKSKYIPIDLLLTKKGEWIHNGVQKDFADIAPHVDVIWNALHGKFGEDGKAQQLFEKFGVPYTGSESLPSAVGMHKGLSKERFVTHGLRVPHGEIILEESHIPDAAFEIYCNYRLPLVVKPVTEGSSVAVAIVHTLDELESAISAAARYGDVLVEEFISGKEATVCVVDSSTPGEYFVLYPIEIIPAIGRNFFDYVSKYDGSTSEICPGRFTLGVHSTLRDLAIKAHKAIGARHYSRSDFIVHDEGIYTLEINTLPGLTSESLVPKALKASGMEFPHFLEHIINLTLTQGR
jgi:D-alanine--D-alanine ligase